MYYESYIGDRISAIDKEAGRITQVARLLRKAGLSRDEANELTELIGNMASENIIVRLESKMDAQNTKYNLLLWFIGAGVVLIVASNFVGN